MRLSQKYGWRRRSGKIYIEGKNLTNQPPTDSKLDDIRELCVDFGIPVIVLLILMTLLLTGIDGEVKTLFAGVVGWIIKQGVSRKKK